MHLKTYGFKISNGNMQKKKITLVDYVKREGSPSVISSTPINLRIYKEVNNTNT